jgi:type I restriction enzyme S subunit
MEQVLYKLPDGWEWQSVKKLSHNIQYGHTAKAESNGNAKFLRITDIQDGKIDWQGVPTVSLEEKEISKYALNDDDLIFARSGATAGKSILIKNAPKDAVFASYLIRIVPNKKDIFPEYLSYFFLTPAYWEVVGQNAAGAAQPNINGTKLSEFIVPVAPQGEQKRIVEKLDALLTRIVTAIEHLQESVTLADALYASALDKEFSKLMKESDILPFKKLVDNQDGRRIPIKAGERKNTHGTYPYYGATGVIDYVDDFIFEGERLLISEDGANLVARKYPIAFIADGKYWVNNHAHVVNALPELTSNLYLKKFFAWVDLSSYITGSAQPKLSQGKLNTIPVPVPPLSEQAEIVAKLDKAYQLTENLKKGVGEKLGMLTSLKASILDSAFKGEL